MDMAGEMKKSDTGKSVFNLATKASNYATNKINKIADQIDPEKQKNEIHHQNAASEVNQLNPPALSRMDTDEAMNKYNKDPVSVVRSAYNDDHKQTVDECCKTFRAIISKCQEQIAMCEDQIKKCKKSGCCENEPESERFGGNKKSVKNTKRKNKVKSVKKKDQ